jgi:hypothetical protein
MTFVFGSLYGSRISLNRRLKSPVKTWRMEPSPKFKTQTHYAKQLSPNLLLVVSGMTFSLTDLGATPVVRSSRYMQRLTMGVAVIGNPLSQVLPMQTSNPALKFAPFGRWDAPSARPLASR